MSDKISDEYLVKWRNSIPHRDSQVPMLREFAEIQVSALDELIARRAADAQAFMPDIDTVALIHARKICGYLQGAVCNHNPYVQVLAGIQCHIIAAIKAAGGTIAE